jgi:large subunit ribosomal protein L19
MDMLNKLAEELNAKQNHVDFKAGDTVTVHYRIKEGNKERVQQFSGTVMQRRGNGITETFTVRKISNNIGVERIFPVNSPFIEKIEVNKKGKVRRARVFYLRDRKGKSARVREKIQGGALEEANVA